MKIKRNLESMALVSATVLMATSSAQAATITFNGGNLDSPASWAGGAKPGAGDVGEINVNGTLNVGNAAAAWDFTGRPDVIVSGGAVLTMGGDWIHNSLNSSTVNNATLNVGDDIFANGSIMNFNAGSTTNVNDDFEANGLSVINITGGTHTTGDTFGAQGNNASTFGTMNVSGGNVTAGQFRVAAFGAMNLGGSAVLSGDGDTSLLAGTLGVTGDWSGSWTISTLMGSDWETEVTGGGWSLDGAPIDATSFANDFVVSNGGQTLALANPVPEPSSLGLLGLAGLFLARRRNRS